jgi:hypothetical protein
MSQPKWEGLFETWYQALHEITFLQNARAAAQNRHRSLN